MKTFAMTKEQIIRALDELTPESLREVQQYLDFLRFKNQRGKCEPTAALGGLLDGYQFTEQDIAQARREMWGKIRESTP